MSPSLDVHETPSVGISPDAKVKSNGTVPVDQSRLSTSETWSPQTILSTIPNHSRYQSHTASPVPFFHLLTRLKTTKREGWKRFGIDRGESIADHMYRMSILTMLAPKSLASRVDVQRCTKMALIHDMAESLVGDITPVDGVPKVEKNRREAKTMDYICSDLLGQCDSGFAGQELRELWQEYEDGQTLEAQFVKDIDKIELVLQMVEYEKEAEGHLDLSEFSWVAKKIVLPEVQRWCEDVLQDRATYWKTLAKVPIRNPLVGTQEAQQVKYYGSEELTTGTKEASNGTKE